MMLETKKIMFVLVFLATVVIKVESAKSKSPTKTFVVLPQIGQHFLKNKEKLMSSNIQKIFTDFITRGVFKLFKQEGEVPAARFKGLLNKEFNEQLSLHVGRTTETFRDSLFALSGYTKLGFHPNLEKGQSKRIKVVIDVHDSDRSWIKNYRPFSFAVDRNKQIVVYENNYRPIDYEALYTGLDSKVKTIVPVSFSFGSCF